MSTDPLDTPVTITMTLRSWSVVVAAARSYNVRVPTEQGDGGQCLDVIERACDKARQGVGDDP